MYEDETYEALLDRALSRISSALDKREGSMVMNGVAPSVAELAQLYIGLDFVFNATYTATAPREYLILRGADRNILPKPASKAVFHAEFDVDVPEGSRFSCDDLNFVVEEKLNGEHAYRATCEMAGAAANDYSGTLVPIDYIDGLTSAELVELIIPGEDEEETETYRQRILDSFQSQAFGGNQSDYKEKVSAMPGVGGVKIHPAWNADISPAAIIPGDAVHAWYDSTISTLEKPVRDWLSAVYGAASAKKLTVGGAVRVVVLASDFSPPSDELVADIQTALDPVQNAGEGMGIAPIGHVVTVEGVKQHKINVELKLTFTAGWSWEAAASYVNAAIDNYFGELARSWEKSDSLIVRISQIESRILAECPQIVSDIGGTKLNGREANVTLDADSIPIRGDVSG